MLRKLANELEIINKLNSKFIYKADSEVYRIEDYWKGFQEFSDTKKYWIGDCDDYSLYLWSNIKGSEVYYCEYFEGGHMVCKLPNGFWIDNNLKFPTKTLDENYKNLKKYEDSYILKILSEQPYSPCAYTVKFPEKVSMFFKGIYYSLKMKLYKYN